MLGVGKPHFVDGSKSQIRDSALKAVLVIMP